jgi:hypothetical protein
MSWHSLDGYLTQVFRCGHCDKLCRETRKPGTGRRGAWRSYCSVECRQAAKRLRDRRLGQERYRRRKGLCVECGGGVNDDRHLPYCGDECDDLERYTIVTGESRNIKFPTPLTTYA